MNMKCTISVLVSALFCYEVVAIPLFNRYPELTHTLAHIELAQLPTPLMRCSHLERVVGHPTIFVKRDDLTATGNLYGGNKVRKLEFLLADAVRTGAKSVITYGCVGSNHALATACYAHQLGLACTLMLKPQPNSWVVRQNLLLDRHFNAEIMLFPDNATRSAALEKMLAADADAYFIPTGGSVPLGAVGYVNAAFELREHIMSGAMPQPDVIYLPVGSCGTTAGLLLGLVLAQIPSKIIAVAVEPEDTADEFAHTVRKLFMQTNQLLNALSPSIPLVAFPEDQLTINKDFCGVAYGAWLPAGDVATALMLQAEGIVTEGTYSAKPIAALCADIAQGIRKQDDVVLLWNTYCGNDFSHITQSVDYKQLHAGVHTYFEEM